jgi:hypothetical protein
LIPADVDLSKGDLRLAAKRLRVFFEPESEVLVGRGMSLETVFDHELELLSEPAPNDGVVPIEAHRHRLADRHLFPDVVVDQPFELGVGG